MARLPRAGSGEAAPRAPSLRHQLAVVPALALVSGALALLLLSPRPPGVASGALLAAASIALVGGRPAAQPWRQLVLGMALAAGWLCQAGAGGSGGTAESDAARAIEAVVELVEWPRESTWSTLVTARLVAVRGAHGWQVERGLAARGGTVRVQLPEAAAEQLALVPGKRLRVRGMLETARPPVNSLLDDAGRGRLRGHVEEAPRFLKVKSLELVQQVGGGRVMVVSISQRALRWRGRLADFVRRAPPQSRLARSFGAALWLGDQSPLPEGVRRDVEASGLGHLFAASGLHVGLVCLMTLLALRGLLGRGLALDVSMLTTTWAYAWMVGLGPAVLRAGTMCSVWVCARRLHRRPRGVQVLSLALLLGLAGLQWERAPLGFALSFAAMFGIVAALSYEQRVRAVFASVRAAAPSAQPRAGRLASRLLRALMVSLGAQWATLPLILAAFGRWSGLVALGNLLAIPIVALLLPVTLVSVSVGETSAVAPVTTMAAAGADRLARALAGLLVALSGSLAFSSAALSPIAWTWWPMTALLTWGALRCLRFAAHVSRSAHLRPATALQLLSLLLLLLLCAWAKVPALVGGSPRAPGAAGAQATIQFLDVGQGDATLLTSGARGVLVDGGGWQRGSVARRVLEQVLMEEGVVSLDAIVLTHGDLDHCGGLLELAQGRTQIGELWISPHVAASFSASSSLQRRNTADPQPSVGPPGDPGGSCASRLVRLFANRTRTLHRGERLEAANWSFDVLGPAVAARDQLQSANPNAGSLALRATRYGRCVTMTGDLDRRGERLLAEELAPCQLLQVGHHGSRTSTSPELVEAVRPRVAVISAGSNNRYGHPHETVVERLCEAGVTVLRTDRDGRVVWRFGPARGWRLAVARDRAGEGSWRPTCGNQRPTEGSQRRTAHPAGG